MQNVIGRGPVYGRWSGERGRVAKVKDNEKKRISRLIWDDVK